MEKEQQLFVNEIANKNLVQENYFSSYELKKIGTLTQQNATLTKD